MPVKNAALRRFSTPTPHATVQYWKKCDEEKLLDTPLLVTPNEADEGDDLRLPPSSACALLRRSLPESCDVAHALPPIYKADTLL